MIKDKTKTIEKLEMMVEKQQDGKWPFFRLWHQTIVVI